ncbi:MAG: hypothetical protein RI885_1158 [Actinomycetota bacterium]|jgi:AcrR family transcriptional regulator
MPRQSEQHGTRDRILIAAATMLGEDPTARLSVRGVAERAGVSTGSLRHFFPTQRLLIDTVVAGLDTVEIPDDPIHDTKRAPTDRLLACLRLVLEQVGTGERARAHMRRIFEAYILSSPTGDEAVAYLALERLGRRRIERWLAVLADEGAIATGDVGSGARFLLTVLNGLLTERALPAEPLHPDVEEHTLRIAVHAVIPDAPVTIR